MRKKCSSSYYRILAVIGKWDHISKLISDYAKNEHNTLTTRRFYTHILGNNPKIKQNTKVKIQNNKYNKTTQHTNNKNKKATLTLNAYIAQA